MVKSPSQKPPPANPQSAADACRLEPTNPLFAIGTFDGSVTVLSQQRRALNLAWALIESRMIPTLPSEPRVRIAVVGAGFAGLTFAAALLQKRCQCDIVLLEERDTLLPLQQGSDTRWLHPHIYDWPEDGSEATAAMLPVLNWTAARASDVVVQVLSSWKSLVREHANGPVELYCNTRHLQIQKPQSNQVLIEWVGEERANADGNALANESGAKGQSRVFDLVVLAVGFGLEFDNPSSYWRNEMLSQPSLNQPRRTYLVSGQGDGAMIDLLRLKISQFRQDRILAELFSDKPKLLSALKKLRNEYLANDSNFHLFDRLDALSSRPVVGPLIRKSIEQLRKRLRRDTELVLRLKVRNISQLLDVGTSRISFQNAVLVYLLYRAGGFAPSIEPEIDLVSRFAIKSDDVIRRHGTDRIGQIKRILPPEISGPIAEEWEKTRCPTRRQPSDILWNGGYFGFPGRLADAASLPNKDRKTWRKEYLPGPTSLVGLSIASAVAAAIGRLRPKASHFRVTLHRVLLINNEQLLQQVCGYVGRTVDESAPTAARTFPAENATIGLAYRTRRIVRSRPGILPADLIRAMITLNLNEASSSMSEEVGFVAAIPVLQPDSDFFQPSPVSAILYFDSHDQGFDLNDEELWVMSNIVDRVVQSVGHGSSGALDRIENVPLHALSKSTRSPGKIPASVAKDLLVSAVAPPRLNQAFVFNFDHSDLTPIT